MAASWARTCSSCSASRCWVCPSGQATGATSANFGPRFRYTGAALTSDIAWLIGAAFAPLVALGLSAHFGLAYLSSYLLSGAACTLAALGLNRSLEIKD